MNTGWRMEATSVTNREAPLLSWEGHTLKRDTRIFGQSIPATCVSGIGAGWEDLGQAEAVIDKPPIHLRQAVLRTAADVELRPAETKPG